MPFSLMTHLECSRCGAEHVPDMVQHVCHCGGPLLARYDMDAIRSSLSPGVLARRDGRTIWRYHELLPVRGESSVVSLGEGMTPLLPLPRLGASLGVPDLLMKDEGLNPTGTFKARGAATGVSRARELGVTVIAMPSNGNAAGAWSSYGSRAGMEVVLCVPTDAPQLAIVEAEAAGAHLFLVEGQITDAGAMIAAQAAERGWYDAATFNEPYRTEGKKTMAYELAEQMNWELPDAIIYPTGGGVGIIGIHKALREMRELGWLAGDFPKLIAVQAAGCAPIVNAFQRQAAASEPWPRARTIAQGIRVPKARADFLVLDAVRDTGGTCVAVSDDEILAALRRLARAEGVLVCPEGAAAFAAIPALLSQSAIRENDRVVVLNTGSGLKYPGLLTATPPVLRIGDRIPSA